MRIFICNKKGCRLNGKPCWLIDDGIVSGGTPSRCQWTGKTADYGLKDLDKISFERGKVRTKKEVKRDGSRSRTRRQPIA